VAVAGLASAAPPPPDWLIDSTPYVATALASPDGREVTLANGLVRRVVRLQPNAATVAFDNLITGASLLRSVRPEARVVLEGASYDVGGLSGQPVHNYLDAAWVDKLEAEPGAFRFKALKIGKTEERFAWKKRSEWMAQDSPWPAPGVGLTLEFDAPVALREAGRPLRTLLADDFASLSPAWALHLSPRHPRTSFRNEGKIGEIMACENTCAYAEQPWPAGAVAVQCVVDPGTDRSASWGPGLALVFANETVKFNLRPGKGAYGLLSGGQERELGKLAPSQPVYLRMTLLGEGRILCEAAADGKTWEKIGELRARGLPKGVRLGKLSRDGGASDFSESGELERCRVSAFRILGRGEESPTSALRPQVTVEVHYELYDGLPLLSKWLVVRNGTDKPVRLDAFVCEILAAVEPESIVDPTDQWESSLIHVETDYAFGGMSPSCRRQGVHWLPDPAYTSQVNYELKTPCLLECRPPLGPDQLIAPGGRFESFRVFELALDSTERERKGLALRRLYRAMAPWVTENPVLMHVRSARPEAVRLAVDQCAEAGFEMVIMTFGSGFDFESRNPKYQAQIKELADYARSKHIALGGYSLLASRGAATGADNTQGVPARFGVMPCLGARWGQDYLAQLRSFMAEAGLGVLEHDGSYPGDRCAATNHPGHRGLNDSQWVQWKAITGLYQWCRANGIYLNIPDFYFLSGSSKTGMGYREVNWSLPRAYQEIIERQNIFDGTWEKTPAMGWMFVPLTEYQGGGAAATIEPLKDHLDHYETRLANLFGAGVIACYRGPRLYDTPETRAVVKRWVDFYKGHRAILDSDLIHLRRADGRDWDGWLHVNPRLPERGLAMFYNPLVEPLTREIRLPLYYTGLANTALLQREDGTTEPLTLARDGSATVKVRIPAKSRTWLILRSP
jgi:hypothetical protein